MKIHNYGNDYAQSMKFQNKKKEDVANRVKSDSSKAGKEAVKLPETEESAAVKETAEGAKEERQGKKEKKGASKK